jgi:hypothetical protein
VAFRYDLGDWRWLNTRTAALNSAKRARSPEAWIPTVIRRTYIQWWVAVKHRWPRRWTAPSVPR